MNSEDGCLANCTIPLTCLDIKEFDPDAGDGEYIIEPTTDNPWAT